MFSNLGAGEIILILLVILILFGAKKIPELAKGLGKGMSEFKKGLKEVEGEIKTGDSKEDKAEK
jgi:sec-independent protein translocase protein TatA